MYLSGYQILKPLYESNHSELYQAIREIDQLPVILKILKDDYPDAAQLNRYQREYELMHSLQTESVIKTYGIEKYQNSLMMIIEDFGGDSLKTRLTKSEFSLTEFLHVAQKAALALAHIHAANIIHKDINPSNLIYNTQTGQLKVIDFGIATQLTRETPTLKNPNILEGTLAYISPEQTGRMNRSLDYRSDFYSLGITFYELLTQKLPFVFEDDLALIHAHIAKQPLSPQEINPQIPTILSKIILKLIAKNAEDRYQSAWGLAADLEKCALQLQENATIVDFPLGLKDISDKFQIPQKLYGRETEINALLSAFERIAQHSELVLIAGYSGIGKTALVQEIYKPMTEKRGFFISGKFDQFQHNIPYSAMISAFQQFVKQLLTENEYKLRVWKHQLLTALGSNAQIILDVIPEMVFILGAQPQVAELEPFAAQNRFNSVFQKFIHCCCTKEHPLVLFLDDLQWADSATLEHIALMMTDANLPYLLLIGAYRDNEVNRTHPLRLMLDDLAKTQAAVKQMTLNALQLHDIEQLIAATLKSNPQDVHSLAELVQQKTAGNPFFINEFLKNLYHEALITFAYTKQAWQWDTPQIAAKNMTDNVVDLMLANLKKLPATTQNFLQLASCIGAYFDLETLAIISKTPFSEVAQELACAIQAELILSLSSADEDLPQRRFKFLHDRVQQAAYLLIPEHEKAAVHWRIGQLLFTNQGGFENSAGLSEKLFNIVDHLNLALTLVKTVEDKWQLVQLNFQAGQKAKAAAAHQATFKYLETAIQLLPEDGWETGYALTLATYVSAVESAYLIGSFRLMRQWAVKVHMYAKDVLEQIKVYEIKIQSYISEAQHRKAIDIARRALYLLDVNLPEVVTPTELAQAVAATANLQDAEQIAQLLHLPSMDDVHALAAVRLLCTIISSSFQGMPELFPIIISKAIGLLIRHGNMEQSPYVYAGYGLLLCSQMKIDIGYQWGQVATQLLDRMTDHRARAMHTVNAYVNPWKEPLRQPCQHLREIYQIALAENNIEYAGYAARTYCQYTYLSGQSLIELKPLLDSYLQSLTQMKLYNSVFYLTIYKLVLADLMDSNATRDSFNTEDGVELLKTLKQAGDVYGLFHFHNKQLYLSYLFDKHAETADYAQQARTCLKGSSGHFASAVFYFYDALAKLASYLTQANQRLELILESIAENQTKLQTWATHAPANFQHKSDLIAAEVQRVQGNPLAAMEFYELAITGAKTHQFLQEEALAYELAGKFYLDWGKTKIAGCYLKEAHYAYQVWGAAAKVKQLETTYPQFLQSSAVTHSSAFTTMQFSVTRDSAATLDLAAVMKANQAIAGEIVLDNLMKTLMTMILQSAGAQKGYLILAQAEKLLLEAFATVDSEQVILMQSQPVELCSSVPQTLISYVARAQTTVILHNATQEGNFTYDPYIQQQHPQSILCAPLIHQGKLISLIYLENNLVSGAFTAERVEVLNLLSSQAAVSLENAKLYTEVRENEQTLKQFLDSMPVAVFITDNQGAPFYSNALAQQILGQENLKNDSEHLATLYQGYIAGTNEQYPLKKHPIMQAIRGQKSHTDDIEIQTPYANKRIPLEAWGNPILNQKEEIIYAVAVFQDISVRKQAEMDRIRLVQEQEAKQVAIRYSHEIEASNRELAQTLHELKETQQHLVESEKMAALGQLIAGVAHEINTPLGAISSSATNMRRFLAQILVEMPPLLHGFSLQDYHEFLEILDKSLNSEINLLSSKEKRQKRKALEPLLDDIEHADAIADNLVDMGICDEIEIILPLLKRANGRTILEVLYKISELHKGIATINLATERTAKVVFALKAYSQQNQASKKVSLNLIDSIETILTLYANQTRHGVILIKEYAADLPLVVCHPDELNQVWTNLIHNALQAMNQQGTLTIRVTQHQHRIQVDIQDSGIGIPQEHLAKVFEAFFTTKNAGEGSGLGLHIVKKIIDKHNGEISVQSSPGCTVFTIFLPLSNELDS